ncbi:hypothetical protein [Actinoplanes rectilineatus]|uniref:hypothetical protein n=1 Tax=Actinoplanes rectilineatus TaxID=113571 RepID=UPI0012F83E6A|nr:hypothetical protein [Actinoplanes rectilineatus]
MFRLIMRVVTAALVLLCAAAVDHDAAGSRAQHAHASSSTRLVTAVTQPAVDVPVVRTPGGGEALADEAPHAAHLCLVSATPPQPGWAVADFVLLALPGALTSVASRVRTARCRVPRQRHVLMETSVCRT